MKGQITNWKEFVNFLDMVDSMQIGEDLFIDKSQMKERAYEAYKNKECIEIFF